ncbi:MAG: cytochrome c oxidase subunit II [Ferrimicrobium sp.]
MALTHEEAKERKQVARTHGWHIFLIWLVLTLIGDYLVWFVWGPHMPPGDMTSSANGQQFDFKVLTTLVVPVLLMVWVYGGYSLVNFRATKTDRGDGVDIRGNKRVQSIWYVLSTIFVISLAGFGTYELINGAGVGTGEGPSPIWKPTASHILVVQVLAQQWRFTYRWPQFGGMETTSIDLPVNTTIEFQVTSLDVIHDFWAYQLGVKADANPAVSNVAYTQTYNAGRFVVRCDELCGIWHGAMYNYGHVVSKSTFYNWAHTMQIKNASVTKLLPPFATTYTPSYSGAGGGYYPSQDPNGSTQKY